MIRDLPLPIMKSRCGSGLTETAALTMQQTDALHAVDGLHYLVGMLGGGRE